VEYKLYQTKLIHSDEAVFSKLTKDSVIQGVITAEIYKAFEKSLPIIMEGQFKILQNGVHVGGYIFHTKVILTFEANENPITDLVKMIDAVKENEEFELNKILIGTPLEGLKIHKVDKSPEVRFNKAYEIMEAAKQRQLLI
jgi:hypothetical protein